MKLLHLKRTKKKNGLTAFFTIRIIIITDAPALLFLFYLFALSALACCSEVTVTSVSLSRLCRVAVLLIQTNVSLSQPTSLSLSIVSLNTCKLLECKCLAQFTLANNWNIWGSLSVRLGLRAHVETVGGRWGGREEEREQFFGEGNLSEHMFHGNPVRGNWPRAETVTTVTNYRTHPHTSSTKPLIVYPRI